MLFGHFFSRSSHFCREVFKLRQSVLHWKNSLRIIQVHLWLEREIPESADSHIDEAERGMIDAYVAAAFRAITTIADVAAFEFAKKLGAFDEAHVLPFP